jgi:putative ubiquitin-RnfH superfamily antitoxin RatB of RatAB toxin-antitoxin module
MVDVAAISVTVLYSPGPRAVREWTVILPPNATVLQALQASGMQSEFPDIDMRAATVGIWNREVSLNHALRDNDRVEVYRGLRVDPKVARRERFQKQGIRSAGLFARKKDR